tara:strand:+ start:578 stop:892 length:315 start_codon:yes stop_codon:yes gene_type:complete
LTLAILSEVTATSFLKSSDGFTKFWPSVIVVVGYCLAFYFLSLTLDTIPIGVAYAVWSGVGIASIAIVSVIFFDQKIDTAAVIGMGLIIAGVVVLRVFSEANVD